MDANNKASNVWSKYLAGELSEDDVNIIEYYLEKHAKKLDKVTVTPAIKATKKADMPGYNLRLPDERQRFREASWNLTYCRICRDGR